MRRLAFVVFLSLLLFGCRQGSNDGGGTGTGGGKKPNPPTHDLTLKLDSLKIHGEKVEAWSCKFDSKHKNVIADDIEAKFKLSSGAFKVIPLIVKNCPAELEYGKPTTIRLIAPSSKDEYDKWEHDVEVTRKALPPQIQSVITAFIVNNKSYDVENIGGGEFVSDIQKPVISIETNRMFSKVESEAFDIKYPDNYKKDVNLTLKEDLIPNTPKNVTIKIITKEPNQDRDDLPITLSFSLRLKKGVIKITSVSIGNTKVENENETLNVSASPSEIQLNFKNDSVIGLSATLEKKDGSNKTNGNIYGPVATFPSIVLEEGETEFIAKASGTNADSVQFAFKVKYEKLQKENVNIVEVKLDEKTVLKDSEVSIDKATGAKIKVYLDKEYEEGAVSINGKPAINPFSSNKKLFEGTLEGLTENTKTLITIQATAKDKTASTFTFNVTYIKPAPKYITKILAAGDEDLDSDGNLQFATLTDEGNNTFTTLLTGLNLKEVKVEIEDLHGEDLAKLKIEFSKEGVAKKMQGTFVKDGDKYISSLSNIIEELKKLKDSKITSYTLKLFHENTLLETYTLNIKGNDTSGGGGEWG